MQVSISEIKAFKACRRGWALRYLEGLIPVQKSDALQTGSNYHNRVEALEKGEPLDCDYSKESAMAEAFRKYILPKINVTVAEKWVEKPIGNHVLIGRLDGYSNTDGCVIEHKTTSMDISEGGEYEYNLLWDEQVLAYMSMTGSRTVHYTVIKKPTIRIKKNETEEEFYERMVAWYDEDTDEKIRVFDVIRTDDEVSDFEKSFVEICDEIENCKSTYRNTLNCNLWNKRCEYSSVCLSYNPDMEYVEFTHKETRRMKEKGE